MLKRLEEYSRQRTLALLGEIIFGFLTILFCVMMVSSADAFCDGGLSFLPWVATVIGLLFLAFVSGVICVFFTQNRQRLERKVIRLRKYIDEVC